MASASEEGLGSHIEEWKAFCIIMNDCKPLSPANPALAQLTRREVAKGPWAQTGTTLPKINLAGTKIGPNLYQQ